MITAGRAASASLQPVAHGGLVDDQLRRGWIAFELLPQRADGDAEIVDLPLLRRAPHGAQQMGVRENTPGVLRQLGKQAIFLRRQMDLLAFPEHRSPEQVDRDSVNLDRSLIGPRTQIDEVGEVALELRCL